VTAVLKLPPHEREGMLARAARERMGIRELRLLVLNARRTAEERHAGPGSKDEEQLLSTLCGRLVEARQHLLQLSRLSRVPKTISGRLTQLASDLAGVTSDLSGVVQTSAM
jgi:hypothetical protein